MNDDRINLMQADSVHLEFNAAAAANAAAANAVKSGVKVLNDAQRAEIQAQIDVLAEQRKKIFTYDFCMVFKIGDENKMMTVKVGNQKVEKSQKEVFDSITAQCLIRMSTAEMQLYCYKSVQKDELYVMFGVDEHHLGLAADRNDYEILLDGEQVFQAAKERGIRLARDTQNVLDNQIEKDVSFKNISMDIWKNLYYKYDAPTPENFHLQKVYSTWDIEPLHKSSFFRPSDRLKLTQIMLEEDTAVGGCDFNFHEYLADEDHPMISYFPLHHYEQKAQLESTWLKWNAFWNQPLDLIRDYYGEKIAFYFAWLGFYCRALSIASLVGFIWFIIQLARNKVDTPGLIFVALFIALWSTLFVETWQRQEARYRILWGQENFLETESTRPGYIHDEMRVSAVDGKREKHYGFWKAFFRLMFSQTVIWSLITCVLASVIGIFILRNILQKWNRVAAGYLTSILNAAQIQFLNFVYGKVSHYLNQFENHRTDTDYENALIAKAFLFKFVNSYNSLFYIAFFKQYDDGAGGCRDDNCLGELQQQLGILFALDIFVNNAVEFLVPLLMTYLRSRENSEGSADNAAKKSLPERQYELEPFESTFQEFDEMVIQFGFVTLFMIAFPLAPLMALINNVLETRLDATRLSKLHRRPVPEGAENIGTWSAIVNLLSYCAVITNVALICFQTTQLNDLTTVPYNKVWAFIAMEHGIILIKYFVAFIVPDVPKDVQTHIARNKHLNTVIMQGGVEEDDDLVYEIDFDSVKNETVASVVDVDDSLKIDEHFSERQPFEEPDKYLNSDFKAFAQSLV